MSDIPGAPMSHNDPIREEVRCCDCDFTTTVYSDEVRAFFRFHQCWPPRERRILTDLIAELREAHHARSYAWDVAAVNWAEARLREVSGDGDE